MSDELLVDLLEKVEIAGEQSAKASDAALTEMRAIATALNSRLDRLERQLSVTSGAASPEDLRSARNRLLEEYENSSRRIANGMSSIEAQLQGLRERPERCFNIKIGWEVTKPFRVLTGFILTLCAILGAWRVLLDFNAFDVRWWIWTLEYLQNTGGFHPTMVYSSLVIFMFPTIYLAFKWYRNGTRDQYPYRR